MLAGLHTAALHEHDLATAAAVVRRCGCAALAMRLSLARLDPLAGAQLRSGQLELAATGRRGLRLVVDADGPYLLDPWRGEVGALLDRGEEGQRRSEYLAAAVQMVAELGGGAVTFSVGPLPPSMAVDAALERLAAAVLEIAERGRVAGVDVAVRPRLGHFVDSIGRFERLVQWADGSPLVRLAADVGSMVAGGEMPVVDLLGRVGERLAVVYLSDVRLPTAGEPLIGQGSVSAARVAAGLRQQRFAGPVIVEPAEGAQVTPGELGEVYAAVFGR